MSDVFCKCPHCGEAFKGDRSQMAAYTASLSKGDKAESERLLGIVNAYWALRFHMRDAHPEKLFVCGRQGESVHGGSEPKAFWKADGTCSYCGSLSPDQFFAAVEAGAEVGPTDKGYKVYVSGEAVPRVDGAAKFYFQHLDAAGQDRFIALFNDRKMKVGYPGHFYVRPYFCEPA